MNDNIKDLYNELKKSYELGSEEEFRQYLSNENNREALRKELEAEYDVGDSASFSSYLGFNGGQAKAKPRGTYAPQAFLLPSQGEGKAPVARPKTSQQPVVAQPSKPAAQPRTSQPKVSNPYKQSNPVTATYEVGEPTKKAIRQDVATMASPEYQEEMKKLEEETAKTNDEILRNNIRTNRQKLKDKITELRKWEEHEQALRRSSNRPTSAYGAIGSAMSESTYTSPYEKKKDAYMQAERILGEAEDMIKAADYSQSHNSWQEFWKGAGNKISKFDTWDFGITDMLKSLNSMGLIKKLEAAGGDESKLTEEERTMLDAIATQAVVNQYYHDKIGKGYTVGQGTAESIPFMVEMILNPMSGAGSAAGRALGKYIIKKWGVKGTVKGVTRAVAKKAGAKAIAKAAAATATRTVGAAGGHLLGSAGMALTTGAPSVAADAVERQIGKVSGVMDGNGDIKYHGRYNFEENGGKALWKAFAAKTIENLSETGMGAGNEIVGQLLGRGAKSVIGKVFGNNVGRIIEKPIEWGRRIATSAGGREFGELMRRGQFHGVGGEFMEEIEGGITNAIIVKDQKLDDNPENGVFNKENLWDTFLQVAAMSALLGGGQVTAYGIGRGAEAWGQAHQLRQTDKAGKGLLGERAWNETKQEIDNAVNSISQGEDGLVLSNESKAALRNLMQGKSEEERKAIAAYFAAKVKGEVLNAIQDQGLSSDEEAGLQGAYSRGYETMMRAYDTDDEQEAQALLEESMQEASDMAIERDQLREQLVGMIGEENVQSLENSRLGSTDIADELGRYEDEEVRDLAQRYMEAHAAYRGVEDFANQSGRAISQATREQLQPTRDEQGGVRKMTLKDGREVYLYNGELAMNADGTVDEESSSPMITVYDPKEEKRVPISARDIKSVEDYKSNDQVEQEIEDAGSNYTAAMLSEINGVNTLGIGRNVTREDGVRGQVIGEDEDSWIIGYEDGSQIPVNKQTYEQEFAARRLADYEARHPREAEPLPVDEVESGQPSEVSGQPEVVGESLPEGYEAGEPERYEEGMEVLMTVDGEVKPVTIGQRVSLVDREFVYNPEGKIIEYTVEGESEPRHIQEKAMADEVVGYKPMEEREEEVASGQEEAEVPTEEAPVEETAEERAVSTYNGMVERYGEKTGHKIEVTLKDREEELEKKRAALEKAQKAFDEAPVGKEEEAEAAEEKAQEEYDVAKAERDEWARIKEVYDRNNEVEEEVVEQPRESVEESQQTEEQPINNNEDEQYIKDQDTVDSEGGLVDSEVVRQSVPTHWREVLHGLGRHIGRRVSVLDGEAFARRTGNRRVRGEYNPEDNTIYLNADYVGNDEQMMSFVFGHELTHSLRDENPELWDSFVGFVKGAMGEEFEERKAELRERYDRAIDMMNSRLPEGRRKYKKLSDAAIEEEVCADWAGDHMLSDEDAVKQILEEAEEVGADATTLIRRVLDWINGIVEKLKSLGQPADYAEKARDLWQQMYNVAVARNNAKAEAKVDLNLEGIDVDENKGDARMALADILEGEERDKEIRDLMEVTGRDRKTVERWMESEQSLAKIIMDGDNAAILEREIDESVPSIWKNSDYPQGTVEFSNICRKRLPFTTVYSKLQKEFPNTVFNAEALETIRQTMKQNGHDVACGLCFVEDRRQLLGEIGQQFIEVLQGKPFRPIGEGGKEEMNQKQTAIIEGLKKSGDNYVPDLFELLTVEGMKQLRRSHPGVANAFIEYNNARGMQAGRLFQAYSAYHREILGYSPAKVKKINDNGGLRIFSFSDFEAPHLMDLVQVLADCAAKGIKVQGYTKVPEFAKAVKDTKAKVNRSLIAKGVGYVDADYQPKQREAVSSNVIDGKRLLFDLVEGIDVTNPNFFDSSDNENIGNILVGINDEQIRMAMADPFVDYIIPFHTGLKEKIRIKKGIGDWVNYQNSQLEKKVNDRGNLVNADKHGINIYTDVLQRSEELIGHEVRNVRDFQEAFLKAVAEKGWIPRFSQFLDRNEEGEYVYTPGYEKFLVDFKMFDKEGNILPQEAVVPEFDDDFNKEILDEYVEGERSRVPYDDLYNKVKESLGLGEESEARFSFGDGRGTKRNPGYTTRDDGTAISVRAEDAEENGKYTEGRFRTNYGVAKRDFEVLKDLGLIESNEWHHTGRNFAKKDFYEWGDHKSQYYGADNLTPEGSLAARYQEKKKEIGKLAKEYEEAQWEWESLVKKYDNIPTYENYRGDKVRGNTDWLLTPEERERKEKEHEFISTVQKDMGMSAFERKMEHENVDRKYREIAAGHVDDEQLRKEYEERYGERIAHNERADAENEEIRKRNAEKRGKEKILEEIGQMMGMSEEEAKTASERLAERQRRREKEAAEMQAYDQMAKKVEGVREKSAEKRRKFIEKAIADGKAERVTRSKEKPDIVEKEEMNGKYGWFEASSRYNLPVYYSGVNFADEKMMGKYEKIGEKAREEIDNIYKEYNEGRGDVRFSVGEEMDDEYMEAVEKGDSETQQKMVDEAAREAGYNTKGFHQTANDFTVFNPRHRGSGTSDPVMPFGIFIKPTDKNIGIPGDKQMALYARIDNPIRFADRTEMSDWLDNNVEGYKEAREEYERIDKEYQSRFDELDAEDTNKYDELWNQWKAGEISEEEYQRKIDEIDSTQPLLDEWKDVINKQAAVMKELVDAYMRGSEYDGVIINKDNGSFGRQTTTILALDPNQVKSADPVTYDDAGNVIPLSKRFDSRKSDVRFSVGEEPIFYSNAERAVEGIKQEKATAEQWLKMIEKNGGLKAGEDKWLGLSEWLKEQKGSLTKAEVLDYIRENEIAVEEVKYGDALFSPNSKINLETELKKGKDEGKSVSDVLEAWDKEFGDTKLNDWFAGKFIVDNNGNIETEEESRRPINSTRLAYTTDGLDNKREIALVVPTIESWNEADEIHFGDAGEGRAVAWVRFGETTDADGKKVLVIDEIQSKRHQEGREKGYRKASDAEEEKRLQEASEKAQDEYEAFENEMAEKYNALTMDLYSYMTEAEKDKADRLISAVSAAEHAYQNYNRNTVPDAPFEKNWQELAMKRMLRYAAENGYDKVAWTKGEQQAERYDLSKSIKDMTANGWTDYSALRGDDAKEAKLIAINTIDGGEYAKLLVDKSGKVISDVDDQFVGKQLSEIVGKDLAKRLMEDGYQTIEGDGLRIGGEGMKGFYDQILPRFMDKYGKKWGVKTGEVELPNLGDDDLTMWSVDVTPEMRESVMEGQPMFSVPADIEEEGASRFSLVEDEKEIERLESEPKERGYRTVVLNEDGTLGSPMAGKLGSRGKTSRATSGFRFGAWEQAEENPDLADENGKIDLKKPTGKTVAKVNYNPYVHIRPTMLNKQFKEAWERPNLVYVETEYPASELDGGYKAEKAALSVGKHRWQGDYLILSRWDKPMRVMPWEEVADVWAEEFKDKGVNFDIVPPQMRDMLEERGVEILPPHKGMSKECNEAYEEWKAEREQPAEPIARQSVSEVLGEDYGKAMEEVYSKMAEQDRRAIDEAAGRAFLEDTTKDYEGEREKAVGEALEALADKDFEDFSEAEQTMWEEARRAINEATGMDLTDAEMRYILWRGAEGIESGKESPADVLRDMAKREELGLDEQPRFSVAAPNNTPPKVAARESYERMMASAVNQFKEATQDSMLSLKKLYEAIMGGKKFKIEDVPGYENAYLAENRMQSASQAQIDAWQTGYIRPIEKAVSDLCSEGKGVKHFSKKKYDELTDYMMAKHGLERNEVMAKRDAQEAAKNGANYQDAYEANRMKDYAGLTALTGKKDVAEAETEAQRMVDEYEASHNVDELWKAVNNATLFSLLKLQKSGLISKERFDQIRQMYQYYIPLQGFDEKVAENVYAYLGSDGTLGYGTPIKTAKGRKSKADDPIATISMNGEATIRKGNRNEMKKAFLAFVQNHPSDLVSVSDVWLRKNAKGEWEQYFDADLKETDTPEEVERKLVDFEKRMEAEQQQHPNEYKRSSELPDVPFRVVENRDMKQHQVMVQSGGKTYVLTINGNPRAAQALNGMTNPDVFTEGVFGKAMNAGQALNRQLSLFYTTRNPEFTVSNFIRDMLYSNSMTWVKESPNYALRFNRNFVKMNPAHMGVLFAEWESGKLKEKVNSGKASEVEKHFYDFMLEGGETGWTNLKDIEQHKKDLEKSLRREHDINAKTWKAVGGAFDLMNRSVENCARFAAYLTSREMGRSVERSIWDAKEVSVNFNKKGAGDKFLNSKNQKWMGKIGSMTSGLGRGLYVFWNAGVQGLNNIMRAAGRHPGKFTLAVLAPQYILGALAPLLAEWIGGGDDDYYNLPEYVRRSNFCFRWSKDMPWITIPLPIEFRAIYGLGELTTGMVTGKERYTPEETAKQYISQISQILPIDFMEGGGGFHAFIPSMVKPLVEAYSNKGWTGLPIYKKETPWNENNPEWQRAYGSANKQIVDATRWLNEATVREEDVMRAGGNKENLQGVIDWNPARIEYMLKGYFGGYTTMTDRLVKSGETLAGKRDFEWKNVPIASRVLKEGDERTQDRKIKNEYADLVKEYTKTQYQLKQFDEETADPIEKAKRIAYLNYDRKYLHYLIVDEYKREIDRLRRAAKKASGEKAADMAETEEMLKKDMVELIRSIDEKGGLDEIRSNLGEGEAIDESLKEMATERIKPIKGE